MAVFCQEALVPAAATSLFTLLGGGADLAKACEIRIQSLTGAANPVFIGSSNAVTLTANRGAELPAAGAVFQMGDPAYTKIDLRQVFVIGTAAGTNVILVTIVY